MFPSGWMPSPYSASSTARSVVPAVFGMWRKKRSECRPSLIAGYRSRVGIYHFAGRIPLHEPLCARDVLGVVDREALVAVREEGSDPVAGDARPVAVEDVAPRDLQARVLHPDLRQRLVLHRVPGRPGIGAFQDGVDEVAVDEPHLGRMLPAALDRP